jgi:hypothetical protein
MNVRKLFGIRILGFYLFTFLIFSGWTSFAQESECPSLDFRDRYSGVKNQGFHQLCWAFTGSSLLEEQLCLQDPSQCGKALSPIDVSSCPFRYGMEHEESTITDGLLCGLQKGICEESLAPYKDIRFTNSLFWGALDPRMKRSPLVSAFHAAKKLQYQSCKACKSEEKAAARRKFVEEFFKIFPQHQLSSAAVEEALIKSEDMNEFLSKTWITRQCTSQRHPFAPSTVTTRLFPEILPKVLDYYPRQQLTSIVMPKGSSAKAEIIQALKRGRGVGIGVCLDELLWDYKLFSRERCGYPHAVVVNGLQWDAKKKQCQIHILNSFGPQHRFNGWRNLDEIAPWVFEMDQIAN